MRAFNVRITSSDRTATTCTSPARGRAIAYENERRGFLPCLEGEGRIALRESAMQAGVGCATGVEVRRMNRSPHPAHSRQSSALPQMVDPPPPGEGKKGAASS